MASARDDKCFKCDFCTLKLENYHFLTQHLHQFHNIAVIKCDYCPMEFASKSEMLRHVNSRHTYGGKPRLECSICPGTYLTLKGLVRHMNKMHKNNTETFTCKKCSKTYKNRSSLSAHLRLAHCPLAYLKCDKCPKIFYKKETLKIHKEANHKEDYQRAKCSMCAATYKYRTQLRTHELEEHYLGDKQESNINDSDIKCIICTKMFADKAALLEHTKEAHNKPIDIFSCEVCPAVFKLREAFENHLWDEHGVIDDSNEKPETGDYVIEDFVDFESTMMQNYELKQLMKIRKARKFSQKLVIVSYSYNPTDDDADDDIEIDESQLGSVLNNVNTFFRSLFVQQPSTSNEDTNDHSDFRINDGAKFLEIQITEKEGSLDIDDDVQSQETGNQSPKLDSAVEQTEKDISGHVRTFKCSICFELFCDESLLQVHLKNVHDKSLVESQSKTINNKIIHKVNPMTTSSKVGNRKRKHIKEKSYCEKEIGKNSLLQNNIKIDANKLRNKKTQVINRGNMIRHLRSATIESTESKKISKVSGSKISLKTSCISLRSKTKRDKTKPTSGEDQLKCNYCGGSINPISTLEKHKQACKLKFEHGRDVNKSDANLMYPCEHCQALFPCVELLANHCSWQHNGM